MRKCLPSVTSLVEFAPVLFLTTENMQKEQKCRTCLETVRSTKDQPRFAHQFLTFLYACMNAMHDCRSIFAVTCTQSLKLCSLVSCPMPLGFVGCLLQCKVSSSVRQGPMCLAALTCSGPFWLQSRDSKANSTPSTQY